jgi:alkylation response protein AidB-like acyl-CoA dehydrogenase
VPYYLAYATGEQKRRWLPGLAAGDLIAAIAMTEPSGGSDLRSITTRAVPVDGGYVVDGAKTFISNGISADLIIVVVKTAAASISLLVVEGGSAGLSRSPNFRKVGLKSQELAALSFDSVFVPGQNLLGEQGKGLEYLKRNLARERLSLALACQASAAAVVRSTVGYVRGRAVFGRSLGGFQNTRFELAACATEVAAGQALLDQALAAHDAGRLSGAQAATVKLFCSEMQGRVADRCLQLHGGYGYMWEYPVARAYADARVSRIYGGTSEVMKIIIARELGL